MKSTTLYLKIGYRFKLRYSHNTFQLVSVNDRFSLFRVRPDESTVYVGSVRLSPKYIHVEHEFEGLTFYDKHNIDDVQIIHPKNK